MFQRAKQNFVRDWRECANPECRRQFLSKREGHVYCTTPCRKQYYRTQYEPKRKYPRNPNRQRHLYTTINQEPSGRGGRYQGSCPERAARIVNLLLNDPGAREQWQKLLTSSSRGEQS